MFLIVNAFSSKHGRGTKTLTEECSSFVHAIIPPAQLSGREAVQRLRAEVHKELPARQRPRLFVLIPFGYELETLMLHFETLASAADRYLVSEATDVHNGKSRKQVMAGFLSCLPQTVMSR